MTSLSERLQMAIRDIPDFPKPGILFKDIMPIFKDPELVRDMAKAIAKEAKSHQVDLICGIESRGFLVGPLVAQELEVPFIPVRKEGKLPGDTVAYSYDLEYGSATVEVQQGSIPKGSRVLVHDDLLATGGTASAAASLVEAHSSEVALFSFIVAFDFLQGHSRLTSHSSIIHSLIRY